MVPSLLLHSIDLVLSFFLFFFFNTLDVLGGLWVPSFLTRYGTHTPCCGSAESTPGPPGSPGSGFRLGNDPKHNSYKKIKDCS